MLSFVITNPMLKIDIRIDWPYSWRHAWNSLFKCPHDVWTVTSSPFDKWGMKESHLFCRRCGRGPELTDTCLHRANAFGVCTHCNLRLERNYCKHEEVSTDPDNDIKFCENCGETEDFRPLCIVCNEKHDDPNPCDNLPF